MELWDLLYFLVLFEIIPLWLLIRILRAYPYATFMSILAPGELGCSGTAGSTSPQSLRSKHEMSWIRHLRVSVLFASLWFGPYPLLAQSLLPIQAELLQRLNARKVRVGDSILAKLALPWSSSICELRAGAIIQGHVVTQKAHSKTENTSEIGIVFESGQCGGREMKPLFLTLTAVLAPLPSSQSESDELQPLSSATGLGLNGALRSVSQASAIVNVEPRRAKNPHAVRTGQVVGIPHLAISVGGPDGASILRSIGRDVQLSPGPQLVLVSSHRSEPNVNTDAKSADSNPPPRILFQRLPIYYVPPFLTRVTSA